MPLAAPIVVAHHDPGEIRATLEARHPDVEFIFVANGTELVSALNASEPCAAFSVKCDRFPGPNHRPLVECPSMAWVQVAGSGYEHLGDWNRERVTVTNCAGVLSPFLAETVIGTMIALNHGFFQFREHQLNHQWQPVRFRPLAGQNLLIVGLGHIGRCVADRAKALGMHVMGIRRQPIAHPTVDELAHPEMIDELLPRADIVSLHVRLTDQTRHLLSRSRLQSMRKEAIIINTSRGPVIDESALTEMMQAGHFRGVHLDVFSTEPLPTESPLWDLRNAFLTPHIADNVIGWPVRFAEFFAENLTRWKRNEKLKNVIE